MKYILFLMFFITPPAVNPKDQLWVLQSTSAMEFDSEQACRNSVGKLIAAIRLTDTVKLFGWCFSKQEIEGRAPFTMLPDSENKKGPPMPEFYSGPTIPLEKIPSAK